MSVSPNPIEMVCTKMASFCVLVVTNDLTSFCSSHPSTPQGLTNQVTIKTENISDCVPITSDQLREIMDKMEPLETNEERLDILEEEKSPFLFSSDDLIKLVNEVTPSVKTRISIISIVAPRLTDPRAKMQEIVVGT